MTDVANKGVISNEENKNPLLKLSFGKSLFAFLFIGPIWFVPLGLSLADAAGNLVVFVQAVLIIVSALMFTIEFRKPKPSQVVLVIWIFNSGVIGIPGLSQVLAGSYPVPIFVEDKNLLIAQISTMLASILLIVLLEAPYRGKALTAVSRNLSQNRVRNLTIIMVPAILYAIRVGGGIGSFFNSRGAISAGKSAAGLTRAQSGLFFTGTQALVLFVCAAAIMLRKKDRSDPVASFALVVSSLGLVILANPLSASRFWFFTVITVLALTALNLGAGAIRVGAMALYFGTLFIFPLADYFRRSTRSVGSVGSSAWLTGDFDAFQITGAGIQWVQEHGAVWGHQLLGAMFPVIPRSIWTGKPIDTGIMIARANGLKFENISGPWIAEAIINFGYLGLFVFPVLIAYLFRKVKFRAELFPDDFGIILNAFLVGYLPILMRGSLIQASGGAGIFAIFVWYATPRERKDRLSMPNATINTLARKR